MSTLQLIDHTKDRYYPLSLSSVWDLPTLRGARALVVGAGALGNEVAKNLAMMGVRLIVVLDRDTVEVANLSRSIFFRESDHGRPKADVLAERLREANPDVEVLPLHGDLDEVLGLGLLRRMDMVFSCLDSRLARRTLNRMCEKIAKPWVDGAMENLLGEVTVFMPDLGPCYECGLTQLEREIISEVASCRVIAVKNLALGKVPTTSTMGSIVAAMQVQEGIKVLHGDFNRALIGKRLVINSEANDIYKTAFQRKDECEGHFRFGEVIEEGGFTAHATTPATVLERYRTDTGAEGQLALGREIVTQIDCMECGSTEFVARPVRVLTESQAQCAECGSLRTVKTARVVNEGDTYASLPLASLAVPPFEILEVRGAAGPRWYELTGDVALFPAAKAAGAAEAAG
jgi:molybdopterin/thiamine biosynthesis adenylyltransferase